MHERRIFRARVVASVAGVLIALASGTNYAYSAWGPQLADRLKLSATEDNLVGLAGNLGMYTCGIPIGMFVDSRGPRAAIFTGALLMGFGYLGLQQAYVHVSGHIVSLFLYSFMTGLGGCMTFNPTLKAAALNWPRHRGTATGFPLAGFGLSAFFFSTCGYLIFPGDAGSFLMLLTCGTSAMAFVGCLFLRVIPGTHYQPVPSSIESAVSGDLDVPRRKSSNELRRSPLGPKPGHPMLEPGTSSCATSPPVDMKAVALQSVAEDASGAVRYSSGPEAPSRSDTHSDPERAHILHPTGTQFAQRGEVSDLLPGPFSPAESEEGPDVDAGSFAPTDIRGLQLLREPEFWRIWLILGLVAGIGLMTINNIGNDAAALWRYQDKSVDDAFLLSRQRMHVSILSLGSFSGRLLSGLGSDLLVKTLHMNRIWCIAFATLVLALAQVLAMTIVNPHYLILVSSLSGLGYGLCFGVFPSIVAETFGLAGFTQNWGVMGLAPVTSGYVFNIFYGTVYDHHSVVAPDGDRACFQGVECYRAAYWVTLGACSLGFLLTTWHILQRHRGSQTDRGKFGR